MSSRRKILLIDYDPESIESTRGPLVRAGYDVEVASDGIAGVEAFERLKPDLVLIEPMVPKKHGFQVCQEIKSTAAGRDTPVLITTGFYRGRKHRDEAHESYGCDDYLEKPIAEELLLSTCGKFLIDTQEPPIPLAGEPTAPQTLGPQSPVAESAPGLVDRLPDLQIPGEKEPTRLPALDDLTEDEIQERLDAMIIGAEDPPAADSPAPPPLVASGRTETNSEGPLPVGPEPTETKLAGPVENVPIVDSPTEPTPPTELAEKAPPAAPPQVEALVASPAAEELTARPREATVESLLARDSTPDDVSVVSSEALAEGESQFSPVSVEETPVRSKLPLWIGIAAGLFIVAGITILWMLRDQGSDDPSVEVAAISTSEPRSSQSRTPSEIPPAGLPFEPALETDEGAVALIENADAAPVGQAGSAIDPTPPETTRPVTKQPSLSPPVAVVEEKRERTDEPPDRPKAAVTKAVVAAAATSKPAVEVGEAIDNELSAPPSAPPEPEPERAAPEVDPGQDGESAADQVPSDSLPSSAEEIDSPPVPVVAPETQTASTAPVEPPTPKTRRGDLVDRAQLDQAPAARVKTMPDYPRGAQSMRIEGTVNMKLLVDERGQVEQVEIVSGTKNKLLKQAAADAAENWVYEPGMKDGVPVKVWVTASVNFKL